MYMSSKTNKLDKYIRNFVRTIELNIFKNTMKKFFPAIILFLLSISAFAQIDQSPLPTKAIYVELGGA
ncbi:MAG: hypothetical protein ACI942_002667, partial [Planctomycetota bacterium]